LKVGHGAAYAPSVRRFTMKRKSTAIQILFVALSFLLLHWQRMVNLSELKFYIVALIVVSLIMYSEKLAHKRRISNWEKVRILGKARFILFDYVVIRGGIVSILLILILSLKISVGLMIVCSILPLFVVLAFAGNEEWKQCEEQYTIETLRSVADKFKVMQN
jgi:hypothetical protein